MTLVFVVQKDKDSPPEAYEYGSVDQSYEETYRGFLEQGYESIQLLHVRSLTDFVGDGKRPARGIRDAAPEIRDAAPEKRRSGPFVYYGTTQQVYRQDTLNKIVERISRVQPDWVVVPNVPHSMVHLQPSEAIRRIAEFQVQKLINEQDHLAHEPQVNTAKASQKHSVGYYIPAGTSVKDFDPSIHNLYSVDLSGDTYCYTGSRWVPDQLVDINLLRRLTLPEYYPIKSRVRDYYSAAEEPSPDVKEEDATLGDVLVQALQKVDDRKVMNALEALGLPCSISGAIVDAKKLVVEKLAKDSFTDPK